MIAVLILQFTHGFLDASKHHCIDSMGSAQKVLYSGALAVSAKPTAKPHFDQYIFQAFRLLSHDRQKIISFALQAPLVNSSFSGTEDKKLILPLPLPYFPLPDDGFCQRIVRLDIGNIETTWHFRIESDNGSWEKMPFPKATPLLLLNEIILAIARDSCNWSMSLGDMQKTLGNLPEIGGPLLDMALRRTRPLVDMTRETYENSFFDYSGFAQKHGLGSITREANAPSTVRLSAWLRALLSDYKEKMDEIGKGWQFPSRTP